MSQPHLVQIPLRWSDMDAYGHVNNATFLTLVEQARIEVLNEWYGESVVGAGLLVARQDIDYLAQLPYRAAPVEVAMWCSDIGVSSFELACEVRDPAALGKQRYAVAATTLVRVDMAAGHPCRLGEQDREVLGRFSGGAAPLRPRGRRQR